MPVIRSRLSRLLNLVGVNDVSLIQDALFNLKCESEIHGDEISIEVQSDRIDMFSFEGIAHAIKLYLGVSKQLMMNLKDIGFKVYVDPPVKRPYIAIAAVKNIELDEDLLKDLIEFQERLHVSFGRNRRKVAIGLHDLDKLPSNIIFYRDIDIDKTYMIPLHSYRRMSIREVLKSTEQGIMYGSIAINNNNHPAIISRDEVVSLPPVINSDITRLEPSTKNILIDVTGTDRKAVNTVLNSIIHTLAVYSEEIIGAEVIYPLRNEITPNLSWEKISVDIDFASRWLGLNKDNMYSIAANALSKMGYILVNIDEKTIDVLVPYYRSDILHQVDVVEDLAIGLGYSNIEPEYVTPIEVRIEKSLDEVISKVLREVLVGLGYIEVNTLTMVSSKALRLMDEDNFIRIVNSPSIEIDALRNNLLQSLLILLINAQHLALPIKLFEVGAVVLKCDECYNKWVNEYRIAWSIMDSEIRFEDIHADLYAVLRELALDRIATIRRCSKPLFIDGRCGCIEINGNVIGMIGEVNPEILSRIGIEYPIACVELSINKLTRTLKSRYT